MEDEVIDVHRDGLNGHERGKPDLRYAPKHPGNRGREDEQSHEEDRGVRPPGRERRNGQGQGGAEKCDGRACVEITG